MSDTQRMVRATLEDIAFSIELILERFVTIYEICDEHLESLLRATKNMLDKKES